MIFYNSYWIRWTRIFRHIIYPFWQHPKHLKPNTFYQYIGDLVYYILDVIFLPELYLILNRIIKWKIRHLTENEKIMAASFYNNTIDLDKVLIDDRARFLVKKYNFAYVSFNLINYWDTIVDNVLIHELMHVHQYKKFGIVYIFRALLAQNSKEVYNYGGYQGLEKAIAAGKKLYEFNFEQQASIIEHFYMIKNRDDLRNNKKLIDIYKHYFNQL